MCCDVAAGSLNSNLFYRAALWAPGNGFLWPETKGTKQGLWSRSATFEDGLLKIDLVREIPEAMKPRRIAISAGQKTLEQKKAA